MSQQVATQPHGNRLLPIEDKINREVSSAISVGAGGITFQNAGEVMEFAKMMAVSGSAVPKHLRGQPGACLGIIDDAIRFRTSPYALARKSYFVNDNLAYEAQVIAGIINAFAPLKDRPNLSYEGEGQARCCRVTATFKTGTEREYNSPPVSQIHPKNSPLWKTDPDQQLAYYSLRAWARRWCPEVILGIYDVEEMRFAEMRDVSPQPSLQDRLAAARAEVEEVRDGFDSAFVASETAALAGEPAKADIVMKHDNIQSSDTASPTESDAAAPADSQSVGAATPSEPSSDTPPVDNATPPQQAQSTGGGPDRRKECIAKMLGIATDKAISKEEAAANLGENADLWLGELDDKEFVGAVFDTARKVLKGEQTVKTATKFLEGLL